MKYNLSTLTLFVFSLIILTACDNENDNENVPQVSSTYEFHSILWKLGEGDGIETFKEKLDEISIINNASTSFSYPYTTADRAKESSYFSCENTELLNKWTEDLWIPIPVYIESLTEEYSFLMGNTRAPLYAGDQISLEPSSQATVETDVSPMTKVTIISNVHYRRIKASYCVRFVGEEYKDILEIEGTWTGVFINGIDNEISYDSIED